MRTVHYFESADLVGLIPQDWLTEALDDDKNGTPESFDAIRDTAEDTIDGLLESQYTVPISSADSYVFLKSVSRYLAASICYNRRGYQSDAFPHKTVLDSLWKKLEAIGKGEQQLSSAAQPEQLARPRGAVIQGRSRVYSANDNFTA